MVDVFLKNNLDLINSMMFQDADGTWKIDLLGENPNKRRGNFKKITDALNAASVIETNTTGSKYSTLNIAGLSGLPIVLTHVPVNYGSAESTINSHVAGIDNKLGALTGFDITTDAASGITSTNAQDALYELIQSINVNTANLSIVDSEYGASIRTLTSGLDSLEATAFETVSGLDAHEALAQTNDLSFSSGIEANQNNNADWKRVTISNARSVSVSGISFTSPEGAIIWDSEGEEGAGGMAIRVDNTIYGVTQKLSDLQPATDTLVEISGPSLSASAPTTISADLGHPGMVSTYHLHIPGAYAASTGDKLASVGNKYFMWMEQQSYLVHFAARHKTDDSTTNPKINITIDGVAVSSNDSNLGIQVTNADWVQNPGGTINSSNYRVKYNNPIEINVTAAGGTGDAADLSVMLVFVHEHLAVPAGQQGIL